MSLDIAGAVCFGFVIGWITYRTLRRKQGSGLSDIASVIGAVGGGAVTALFAKEAFSAYCIGLAAGFVLYFIVSLLVSGPKEAGGFMGD